MKKSTAFYTLGATILLVAGGFFTLQYDVMPLFDAGIEFVLRYTIEGYRGREAQIVMYFWEHRTRGQVPSALQE